MTGHDPFPKGSDIIAKFNENKWTEEGRLSKARMFHKTMTFESRTIIFGGYFFGTISTEIWEFERSSTDLIPPEFQDGEWTFVGGFGMYLVDIDFCKSNKTEI